MPMGWDDDNYEDEELDEQWGERRDDYW